MKQKSKQVKQYRPTFTIFQTSQCLKIDKTKINFCKYPIFASSFKQLPINLELMDYFNETQKKDFHLLSIKTHPNTIAQNISVEKLFTIKVLENGEDLTELEIPIKIGEPLILFVKTNIPQLDTSTDLSGSISIQIDQFLPIIVPIISRGEVPQIICLKEMENIKTGAKIIKIPGKGIMKIPFKNCSNINFFFQIKLIGRQLDKPDADGVRINVITGLPPPKFEEEKAKAKDLILKVDANSAFCINLELQMLKKDNPIRIARRILILQVQGTKLLYPFPLEIIVSG